MCHGTGACQFGGDRAWCSKVSFRPTSLETLIDSPVLAGQYTRRIDLDPGAKRPVYLDVVADDPQELAASDAQIGQYRRLVQEAYQLFGSRHFALMTSCSPSARSSSRVGSNTTARARTACGRVFSRTGTSSSRITTCSPTNSRTPGTGSFADHGIYGRPIPTFRCRIRCCGLYEGMTQYWGQVLAARAGLRGHDDALQTWAHIAASLDEQRPGRTWRDLQDTTSQPIVDVHGSLSWYSWQRSSDYYNEGALIWLDADTKIRELTHGQRSLDDFARSFFGVDDGREAPLTYDYADIVKALNAVAPFDWNDFLRKRLDSHGPRAPLDGLTRAGWHVVYRDKPTPFLEHVEGMSHATDLSHSLGLVMGKDSHIEELIWAARDSKPEALPVRPSRRSMDLPTRGIG